MRRLAAALAVLTLVLCTLIGLRLWKQAREAAAPAGGSGEIEGVRVDLSSRVGARIAALHVREGERVRRGQLLVTLDCSDPEAQLAEAQARLAAGRAQAEAAGVQVAASRRGTGASQAARAAALAQAEALDAQASAAERQAVRLASIPSSVTVATVDQTRASALALTHQAHAARAQASASAEQARAAEAAVRAATAQADAAAAQVHAGEAAVARARLLVDECALHAPRDAEVAELPHEAGELVAPGAVLARLVDLGEVRATFYLPNAEVGAVRPGAEAEVVADAFPQLRFHGRVRTVALEAEFTPRNIQTRTDRDRLVYPVEVLVENREGRLRDGMPVQVTLTGTGARAMTALALEASGLHKRFGSVEALAGLSFAVARGELYGLVGADGAGKTTASRALAGLISLDAGSARVLGRDPLREGREVRGQLGLMPQQFSLYRDLTVAENLRFFARLYVLPRATYEKRVARLMEVTRLGRFLERRADALSGGMYKKLALACALLHEPAVLILDEPTNGVDPVSRRELWALLYEFVQEGMAVLVSTPYMDEAERCHRVGLVHRGRLLLEGEPRALLQRFRHEVYEVHGGERHAVDARLAGLPSVQAASPAGARLRAVVTQGEGAHVAAALAPLGARLVPARADFEDLFLSRLREEAP